MEPVDHPSTGTLTRADLVVRVRGLGYTHREAAAIVNAVFDAMCEALERGEDVLVSGFGRFETVARRGRPLTTPRGEPVVLEDRKGVAFRPSKKLRAALTAALRLEGAP